VGRIAEPQRIGKSAGARDRTSCIKTSGAVGRSDMSSLLNRAKCQQSLFISEEVFSCFGKLASQGRGEWFEKTQKESGTPAENKETKESGGQGRR